MAEPRQISNDAARRIWSRDFVNHFDRLVLLPSLASRSLEGEMRTANTAVFITDQTQRTVTDSNSINWPTAYQFSAGSVTMTWDKDYKTQEIITRNTVANLPIDPISQAAARTAVAYAEKVEDYAISQLEGQSLRAVPIYPGSSETVAQQLITGDNSATSTNYLGADGEMKGSGANQAGIYNALKSLYDQMALNNRLRGGRWTIYMPTVAWIQLRDYMSTLDSEQLLIQFIDGRERRSLFGVFDIVDSTAIGHGNREGTGTQSNRNGLVDGKAYTSIYAVQSAGLQYGRRNAVTQLVSPQENQIGPYWAMRVAEDYYFNVVDNRYVWRIAVRSEA